MRGPSCTRDGVVRSARLAWFGHMPLGRVPRAADASPPDSTIHLESCFGSPPMEKCSMPADWTVLRCCLCVARRTR